jgi:hypothetical protein
LISSLAKDVIFAFCERLTVFFVVLLLNSQSASSETSQVVDSLDYNKFRRVISEYATEVPRENSAIPDNVCFLLRKYDGTGCKGVVFFSPHGLEPMVIAIKVELNGIASIYLISNSAVIWEMPIRLPGRYSADINISFDLQSYEPNSICAEAEARTILRISSVGLGFEIDNVITTPLCQGKELLHQKTGRPEGGYERVMRQETLYVRYWGPMYSYENEP